MKTDRHGSQPEPADLPMSGEIRQGYRTAEKAMMSESMDQWYTVNLSAPLHVLEELSNQVLPESYRTLPDGTNTYLAILNKLQAFHGIVFKELEDAIVEYVKEHPGCTAGSIYEVMDQSPVFTSEMYSAAMKSARRTRLDVVRASGNRKLHYLKGKAPSS